METMKRMEKVMIAANMLLAIVVAFWLCSCGSTSGWRVQFGVAPVAAIQEQQTTLDKRK